MSTATTPVWTDNVSVVAAATLARGSTTRGTIDLRGKEGARVFAYVGRTGTTALTNGVDFRCYATINNDGTRAPAPVVARLSQTAAGVAPTISGATAAGDSSLTLSSGSSLAKDDYVCVGQGTANEEFAVVSKVASAVVTFAEPLKLSHANSDPFTNKADVWVAWLPGGATYSVVFDYGDDAAGDSVRVRCLAQTLDSYTTA